MAQQQLNLANVSLEELQHQLVSSRDTKASLVEKSVVFEAEFEATSAELCRTQQKYREDREEATRLAEEIVKLRASIEALSVLNEKHDIEQADVQQQMYVLLDERERLHAGRMEAEEQFVALRQRATAHAEERRELEARLEKEEAELAAMNREIPRLLRAREAARKELASLEGAQKRKRTARRGRERDWMELEDAASRHQEASSVFED
eukprot:Polyplicarium_translucidae@DN2802_c0_g1_i1.p1